jgi:hypothetical protein
MSRTRDRSAFCNSLIFALCTCATEPGRVLSQILVTGDSKRDADVQTVLDTVARNVHDRGALQGNEE